MARALKPRQLPSLRMPKIPRLPDANTPDVFEEMTLQEHLEELRSRVVKTCVAVGLAFVAGWFLSNPVMEAMRDAVQIESEGGGFQTLNPADPLTTTMKVSLYIAIAISMPIIVYQLVGFLAPGLTRREKRLLYVSLPFVSGLFFGGVAFAWFLAAPRALDFLSNFRDGTYDVSPTAEATTTFYLTLMIGLGLAFQLPVIMFLLAALNIVSPGRMAQYRKYAFMGILVASAIITPTVDPFNMLFIAMPLVLLYEVGIVISRVFVRRRRGATAS